MKRHVSDYEGQGQGATAQKSCVLEVGGIEWKKTFHVKSAVKTRAIIDMDGERVCAPEEMRRPVAKGRSGSRGRLVRMVARRRTHFHLRSGVEARASNDRVSEWVLHQSRVVWRQRVGEGHVLHYCESRAAEFALPSAESTIEARIAIDRDRERVDRQRRVVCRRWVGVDHLLHS